jgi:heavy metal translocating P-type ATPase
LVPILAALALLLGFVIGLVSNDPALRTQFWLASLVVCGAPVVWGTLRGMMRGQFAADLVASMAIVGAVLLQEPLAGLVVVIMQTGGEALEAWAVDRASDAVAALEADAPRSAQRVLADGRIEEIEASAIVRGDTLLVRPGTLIPCDVVVLDGASSVDASRLTGEPVPVRAAAGVALPSGAVNGEGALTVKAERVAAESQYARIVELVRSAQASKSPLQRVADKWAVWFTPFTLIVCALAWFISHDATRVLAVLVVATPCPLILAAPVAVIGGISRSARRGIIIRHGGALEALAKVDVAVFDKTGTLTVGRPQVSAFVMANGAMHSASDATLSAPPASHATSDAIIAAPSAATLLDGDARVLASQAASVEQGSGHLLARVFVTWAESHGLAVVPARDLREEPGSGVQGLVDGVRVAVGSPSYVSRELPALAPRIAEMEHQLAGLRAYAGTDGGALGRLEFLDELRPNVSTLLGSLRALGISRTVLLSGDQSANVQKIAESLGITDFAGDLSPADKVTRVAALQSAGSNVLMVGDGTNDAPALSTAKVGVALAGHGGGVSAEAADVVLLVDEPLRVVDAVTIGRYTMRIAKQSIGVGIGLSVIGMGFAAAGLLAPTAGAIVQEVIDVAVIVNALRAARG